MANLPGPEGPWQEHKALEDTDTRLPEPVYHTQDSYRYIMIAIVVILLTLSKCMGA